MVSVKAIIQNISPKQGLVLLPLPIDPTPSLLNMEPAQGVMADGLIIAVLIFL